MMTNVAWIHHHHHPPSGLTHTLVLDDGGGDVVMATVPVVSVVPVVVDSARIYALDAMWRERARAYVSERE